jgi:UDP-N-acetylglucosamine 2-epimerase
MRPDFGLNLMKPTQNLSDITNNVLLSMPDVCWRFDPRITVKK